MKSLLLVAHGSRRAASNDEIRELAAVLRRQAGTEYASVSCAFLELAAPSIAEGIAACIREGAAEIVILPYFLSAGRHVASDVPGEVALMQQAHPEVKMRVAPYLGAAPEIAGVLLGLARLNPA
jgi:sirohydrochlorin ferrochelatase